MITFFVQKAPCGNHLKSNKPYLKVLDNLYENLPDNGSELVLFDVNRMEELEEFILPKHKVFLSRGF